MPAVRSVDSLENETVFSLPLHEKIASISKKTRQLLGDFVPQTPKQKSQTLWIRTPPQNGLVTGLGTLVYACKFGVNRLRIVGDIREKPL